MTVPIRNILTVDVEDWIQSVFDNSAPLTDCFVRNTHRVLEHLAEHGTRATFFVLGLAAEKSAQLVRDIHAAGHDVQSHGYAHRLVFTQSRQEFRRDLQRGKKLLEDVLGKPIVGYRAPAFSIDLRNLWALDVIAECGFEFDASLCPVRTRRYGIDGIPRAPHLLHTLSGRELLELPVTTLHFAGRLWPAGGGGYARLCPVVLLRRAIRQINSLDSASVFYMHPYEYNPTELDTLPIRISLRTRLHQTLGRRRFRNRVDRLLRTVPFGTVAEWRATGACPPHLHIASLIRRANRGGVFSAAETLPS